MTPTNSRRRVKFKQRTPRSTAGGSRRTQRTLVAALLAVSLGAPAALLMRAVVREGLADPAGVARRFQAGAPVNEPLLRLPGAPSAAAPAPVREVAARPAAGWSTPAPDSPVSRSWETPFANGRTVAVAPVAAPAVRAALNNVRDAGFIAPVAPFRAASAPAPVGLHGLTAPALAGLVASSATAQTAGGAAERAPVGLPAPEAGAALRPGAHPHVVPLPNFTWSGSAVSSGSPANPNWNIANNWVGNTAPGTTANANIIYAPVPGSATATNVEQVYQVNSLSFLVGAPSYNVTQNSFSYLSVGAGGITDASASAQTLSTDVYAATADYTITVSDPNGRLNLPGAVFNPSQSPAVATALYFQGANRVVTVDGPGTTNITGVITQGGVASSGALVKNGAGTLILAGNNLYSGGTTLNAGTVDVQNDNALGTGTLTINGGGITSGNFSAVNNPVTVNADFAHATGSTYLSLNGPVALGAATRTITSTDANQHTLAFGGVISGAPGAGVTLVGSSANQNNYFLFFGSAANTYSGPTVVDRAALGLGKDPGAVAIPGDLTLRNNASVSTNGGQLAATTNLLINSGSTFDASGGYQTPANETINALNGDSTGTVSFGNQFNATTLTVSRGTFNGLLQDGFLVSDRADRSRNALPAAVSPFSDTGGQLNKASAGTLTLTHNNTYSGGTLVSAGALFANNAPAGRANGVTDSATGSGNVLVLDGARLGGSGSVGQPSLGAESPVTGTDTVIGGTLLTPSLAGALPNAPTVTNPAILGAGATLNSTAILTINGNLTLTSTALLETELGGSTAGAGYDQILVNGGAIALGGDLSLATINGYALTLGQTFYILDGVSADAVLSGVFANVTPETATTGLFTDAAGNQYRVNYADSDPLDGSETAGNDLSVTVLAVPEPGSLALAAAGVFAGIGAWVRRRRAV